LNVGLATAPAVGSSDFDATTVAQSNAGSAFQQVAGPGEPDTHYQPTVQKAAEGLSPQSVNHLRGYLSRAFQAARRLGRYTGQNPAAEVRKRRVPRRSPDYLRADEVPVVMAALAPEWQPLFGAAIYTGMRKGERYGQELWIGADQAATFPRFSLFTDSCFFASTAT
jgi:integrase